MNDSSSLRQTDAIAWLQTSTTPEAPSVRIPSWLTQVQQAPTITEDPADEEGDLASVELEQTRAERDEARAAVEAAERQLQALRGQLVTMQVECDTLRRMAQSALVQAERARNETLTSAEPELVQLAAAIAERAVARELSLDPSIVVGWAREGILAMHTREELVVALAPDLHAALSTDKLEVDDHHVDVVIDEDLSPGCCEVRSRTGRVEQNMQSRIAAIVEALGSDT
jgi:flagellar assembly protein FliH